MIALKILLFLAIYSAIPASGSTGYAATIIEGHVAQLVQNIPAPLPPLQNPPRCQLEGNCKRRTLRGNVEPTLPGNVRTGTLHTTCIARWEDSHQVHSEEVIVEWNYQAVKTTMKKLVHCMELTVTGPVDLGGVAKGYLDYCVNYGLNNQRTRHALELLAAVVIDVFGGYGRATAVKVTDYVHSAANETINCLSNADLLQGYASSELSKTFDASIREESHWEYWEL